MKRILAAVAVMAAGGAAQAATIDTSNWTSTAAPADNQLYYQNYWTTGGTSASIGRNAHTTLVSDFSLNGDFTYTGTMRATSDNDNMGVVFGWTDTSNHYRMGWEGNGYWDGGSSTENGFWLIVENGGTDTVLANVSNLYWSLNVTYDFSISRSGNDITYSIMQGLTTITSGTVTDSTFLSGNVGVYVESNYSQFSNLAASETSAVPLPATLPLLLAGFGGLAALRRRG